jgi:hypothetical protein
VRTIAVWLMLVSPVYAQQRPVREWADWSSYGTALANPTSAIIEAWQSDHRGCRLARIALSEVVGNGVTLGFKKLTYGLPDAVRPCLDCDPDGWPSGHTMNSIIGSSSAWAGLHGWVRWAVAAGWSAATGLLRHEANRHFWQQIGWGAIFGAGAEAAGQLIRCED